MFGEIAFHVWFESLAIYLERPFLSGYEFQLPHMVVLELPQKDPTILNVTCLEIDGARIEE